MSSQIIKTTFPPLLLYLFLQKNASETDTFFVFNNAAYKKAKYNTSIDIFLEECKQYYHISKYKYISDTNMKYARFLTVIRQICNFLKITYTSDIKYIKSAYDIVYYIDKNIVT